MYYLPHIFINEEIKFSDGRIKQYKSEYDDLHPRHNCFQGGSLIELTNFESGDIYDHEVDQLTFKFLELVKFSYFSKSPSFSQWPKSFMSNETFDMFRLVENNKNPMLEHKHLIYNGMSTFQCSLDDFILSKIKKPIKNVDVKKNEFDYGFIGGLSILDINDTLFSIVHMYNNTWGLHSAQYEISYKAITARTSIEMLIKFNEHNKKTFGDIFINELIQEIDDKCKNDTVLSTLMDRIRPFESEVRNNINCSLNKLKDLRDNLVHDGLNDEFSPYISFYLIWFPLYWSLFVNKKGLRINHIYKFVLFLYLNKFSIDKWNAMSDDMGEFGASSKMSYLYSYVYFSNVLPIHSKSSKADTYLRAIDNWLNES